MTWARAAVALGAAALILASAWLLTRPESAAPSSYPIPGERQPFTVEVLNGTNVDGLARAVTQQLRRAGLDVVFYGTSPDSADSTVILVRGEDPAAANAVREVLGVGRIVADPDPRLLLDATVILGHDVIRTDGGP